MAAEVSDVDGNVEDRRHTVSVFNGQNPEIRVCENIDAEIEYVANWLNARVDEGLSLNEIGIFVRSQDEIPRAIRALSKAGLNFNILDENTDTASENISLCTMHLAKGLEFRAVVVIACDDDIIPLQLRSDLARDEADLKSIHETERQLLYVACTRARDYLLITSGKNASEFLSDLLL